MRTTDQTTHDGPRKPFYPRSFARPPLSLSVANSRASKIRKYYDSQMVGIARNHADELVHDALEAIADTHTRLSSDTAANLAKIAIDARDYCYLYRDTLR